MKKCIDGIHDYGGNLFQLRLQGLAVSIYVFGRENTEKCFMLGEKQKKFAKNP
jgi:hypothetical protein